MCRSDAQTTMERQKSRLKLMSKASPAQLARSNMSSVEGMNDMTPTLRLKAWRTLLLVYVGAPPLTAFSHPHLYAR